jgi:hypothetical protein
MDFAVVSTRRSFSLAAVLATGGLVAGTVVPAWAQAPSAHVQERVRVAIRSILGGAASSPGTMLRMISESTSLLRRQVPAAAALVHEDVITFAKTTDVRTARYFRAIAVRCGETAAQEGEDTSAFVTRASECLRNAVVSTQSAAAIHRIRGIVRNLGDVAVRGARALKQAIPHVGKYIPAGVSDMDIVSPELRAKLEAADDTVARAFGQRATACAALPFQAGETAQDFAKRVSECFSTASAQSTGKNVDRLIARAVDHLIKVAQGGTKSLRTAVGSAVALLEGVVDAGLLFPTTLRESLADASPLVATSFVRGARRCRRMVRGPNQLPESFVRQMGVCLAASVEEASPFSLVPVVLAAVRTVTSAAGKGAEALRKALKEADEQLHGRVPAALVIGGDVRRHIALGKPEWLRQFAKLAGICEKREFKKHHRFDEFVIRVNLCLSSAASGLTPERLQERILESMTKVAKAGRGGARALRLALSSEVKALDRIMRVMDLYPEKWRFSMNELSDTSARAFSRIGSKCPLLKRLRDEGLGQYVKRLYACLETSRVQSGGDALASKVRDAVMSLAYAAQTSAGTLRNGLGAAIAIIRGFVSPQRLFPPALREALKVASDELAQTFATDAKKCVQIERKGDTAISTYVQSVANCLVNSTRGSLDKARQDAVHEALGNLASLADAGPTALASGYPKLWVSLRSLVGLGGTLPQLLRFVERTTDFAKRLRADCNHLPAGSAAEVGQVRNCVMRALSAAASIQPPDACRGRVSSNLAECCLLHNNRLLPSCAAHRFSCRTGQTFQNGQCVTTPATIAANIQCPPGQQASGGVCIGVPCPFGTIRNAYGTCAALTCPAGAVADAHGRCIQTTCPAGSILNVFQQCQSGNCPARTVVGAYGGCVPATCAYGSTMDALGRCQTIVPPIAGYGAPAVTRPYAMPGHAQPGYAQPSFAQPGYAQPGYLAPTTQCPYGTVLGPGGLCVRSFCPPGTISNALGQCVQGGCPFGYVMNAAGQCVR